MEIPLGLSPRHIEEIVILSMGHLNDAEPNMKTKKVVNVTWDPSISSAFSYSKAKTEIPSRDVHTKALVDLGHSFRHEVCSPPLIVSPFMSC